MADLVTAGLLESCEIVTEITGTTAKINCVLGQSYPGSGTNTFSVEWQLGSSDFSGATYTTTSTTDITSGILGQVVTKSLTTLSGRVYYRVKIVTDSTTTRGDVRTFRVIPAYNEPCDIILMTDWHLLDAINRNTTNRLTVGDNTVANAILENGGGNGKPSLVILGGDDFPHGHFNSEHTDVFPINVLGASVSATSRFPLSQQDTDYDCRLSRKHLSTLGANADLIEVVGNHNGEHWWHVAANNGGLNDGATYGRASLNKYFGNSLAAKALSGADSLGRWGAFRYGSALICIFNPYIDTRLSVTNPNVTSPDAPDNVNDTGLDQTQWDYFFHATNGWCRKANKTYDAAHPEYTGITCIIPIIHNVIGGVAAATATTVANYMRGGKSVATGANSSENGPGSGWTNPRAGPQSYSSDHTTLGFQGAIESCCAANGLKWLGFKGHDHCHEREPVGTGYWVTMARFSDIDANPYGVGFKSDGGYTDTSPTTVHRSNSGHYVLSVDNNGIHFVGKRSYVAGLTTSGSPVPDPADGITTNLGIFDQLTIRFGAASPPVAGVAHRWPRLMRGFKPRRRSW